jgi:hypothetical protein
MFRRATAGTSDCPKRDGQYVQSVRRPKGFEGQELQQPSGYDGRNMRNLEDFVVSRT